MKVDRWLKDKNLDKIREWASAKENTIAIIAAKMGVSPSTFYYWLNEHEEIKEAFDDGRRNVDEEVESSFFKLCTGFKETLKKPQKIKRTEFDERGRKIEYEEIVEVEEEVYIKPDVTAQKFYLTNRKPDKWKNDTKDLGFAGDENNTGVVMLPEIEEPEEHPVIEADIVKE